MLHIYKASAGSGKTFALTRQYLTLLLGERNPETGKWRLRSAREGAHRHILAITFTNKATQEMTRRIISQLAILAGREPQQPDAKSPYLSEFMQLFGTDRHTLARQASDVLDELLADFAFFHVSTIDAFFQNVLRIFAREVEMPDNFRLELDNSSTISLGINEMFTSLNFGRPADPVRRRERQWLTDWLTRHMMRMFDAGASINILARSSSLYSDLVATFTRLLDETFQINAKTITAYLDRVENISAFETAIENSTKEKENELRAKAVALMQYGDYMEVNRYIRSRVEQWAAGDMADPTATVAEAVENPAKRFKAAYYKKGVPQDFDFAVASLCAAAVDYKVLKERNKALINAITPLGLLGCLIRHINNFCKDNNVILLSDTNTLLRDIINDDETPFVYERLGYYLRHFLIDEVQDTSRMQWDNLRPLVMESLSHSHENLVIGDEKQCIYRFRNSDPELLGHIISDDIQDVYGDDSVAVEGNTIEQNNNWRSSEEVVKFNNSIFHALASITGVGSAYSNVIQQISHKRADNVPGHVKMIFEPEENSADDTATNDEEDSRMSAFALQATVNEVDRLLDAGYRRGQIAVLVRKHSEGEAVIKKLLHCHETPGWRHGQLEVKSTDAVGISSSPAVKMIIEILRLTQLPHMVTTIRELNDGTTEHRREENPAYRRARLLYCYQYYLHTTVSDPDGTQRPCSGTEALSLAIEAIRNDENNGLGASSDSTPVPPGNTTLKEILDFATSSTSGSDTACSDDSEEKATVTCLTLTAIVDKIISRYVIPDVLPEETAFLTAFQDLVYDFCSQGNSDIRSFLAWWDRGGCRASLSSTSESDAINVMTIHQSKGLEYPCVIIPFCNTPMVTFSNRYQPSYHWMPLDKKKFPGVAPDIVPPMVPVEFTSGIPDIDLFADEARRIVTEQLVDSLNICYVAFTRAVNELVVIAPRSKKQTADSDVSARPTLDAMLRKAVESLTQQAIADDTTLNDESKKWVLPLAGMIDADTLEIGSPTSPVSVEKKSPEMPVIDLPPYSPEVNDRLVTLTEADIELFDFDNPRHRGNFLHRVLSKVRRRADLPRALRRAAARARLTQKQTEECESLLTHAVNDPQVSRWFEGYARLYREQSIANRGIDRRPDRIVVLDDGSVEIIDYKFGDDHPAYTSQIRRYMALMRKAGYPEVRGYLWFVPTNTIRQVSP
ncbi:MAG: UvrD-helicase domain-containing protein [Muribaculaceae bacterium]|nr:UvrD-helicase domain-containing protein [Muribaculaceae bacterium]